MRIKKVIGGALLSLSLVCTSAPAFLAADSSMGTDTATPLMAIASKGTPIIDGTIDSVWSTAKEYTAEKWDDGKIGVIKSKFRVLWDEKKLYVLGEVKDPKISTVNGTLWEQDSFEVFVNELNVKSDTYTTGEYQLRISANDIVSAQFRPETEFDHAAKITSDGYVVEFGIPYTVLKPKAGDILGFDVQINDDPGSGRRETFEAWNDKACNDSKAPNNMGKLQLSDPSSVPTNAENNDEIKVQLNGKPLNFADQKPVVINDRTLVPLRGIFEALGAKVDWDDETQTVIATQGDTVIGLKIGDESALVNGQVKVLDQPALLLNDRTMVPLRFVSEALGASVDWDEATATVSIKSTLLEN